MRKLANRILRLLLMGLTLYLVFSLGVFLGPYRPLPSVFRLALQGLNELSIKLGVRQPWYFRQMTRPYAPPIRNTPRAYNGLNLITRVGKGRKLSVDIMTMSGQKIHEWKTDWFKIWPNATHLPEDVVPQSRPGTHVHGVIMMKNGDIVFNFETLGLVRLDLNGDVVWRLPYRTHHSVHRHDDGNLWVCGLKERTNRDPYFPNHIPPFAESTLLEVSPGGKILHEWSVAELLRKNNLGGLLSLARAELRDEVRSDRLHLNDVEPFSAALGESFFVEGDVLVSLRNINTVFVFNGQTAKIKFICVGWFNGQHDPDFIDGNSFSVFDNNAITRPAEGPHSRIVIVSARTNTYRVFFEGTPKTPFHTDILGKHQWLPNGNLLISESVWGRAFEITPRGEVVWEYTNYVGPGIVGLVEEVQRLPLQYTALFRHEAARKEH